MTNRNRAGESPSTPLQAGLMAPIITVVEIARAPKDVFAYATDPRCMSEWQRGCLSGRLDGTGVGARCTTVREIGGRKREVVTEITTYDPPWRWADRGINGPIRAIVTVQVEPLVDGLSRLTLGVDFSGHGIGRLLVPLVVRRQARAEMPANVARLKHRLESVRIANSP